MLVLKNLRKKLENFTLEIDELEIMDGEYFVILGLSGAGKTTLLEVIAGFRKAEGKIILDGEDVSKRPINDRKIVMCHGRYLFPHMSVKDNIGYGIKNKSERDKRVKEVAKMIGIDHLLNRKPETLSMGEQQRVALARALAVKPKVILLDEPLNSLDRLTHESLMVELRRIHEETGITFIHVTHDFIEAVSLADRMAILKDGKIEQFGCVEEILRKPKNVFVARFVGVKNLIEGQIRKDGDCFVFESLDSNSNTNSNKCKLSEGLSEGLKIKFSGNGLKINGEKKCVVGIRPEDVLIVSNNNCRLGSNVFTAEVVDVYPVTLSTVRVLLKVNGVRLFSEVVRSKALIMGLKRGEKVKVCITSVIPIC